MVSRCSLRIKRVSGTLHPTLVPPCMRCDFGLVCSGCQYISIQAKLGSRSDHSRGPYMSCNAIVWLCAICMIVDSTSNTWPWCAAGYSSKPLGTIL